MPARAWRAGNFDSSRVSARRKDAPPRNLITRQWSQSRVWNKRPMPAWMRAVEPRLPAAGRSGTKTRINPGGIGPGLPWKSSRSRRGGPGPCHSRASARYGPGRTSNDRGTPRGGGAASARDPKRQPSSSGRPRPAISCRSRPMAGTGPTSSGYISTYSRETANTTRKSDLWWHAFFRFWR